MTGICTHIQVKILISSRVHEKTPSYFQPSLIRLLEASLTLGRIKYIQPIKMPYLVLNHYLSNKKTMIKKVIQSFIKLKSLKKS